MKRALYLPLLAFAAVCCLAVCCRPDSHEVRTFIAHRGVNMGCTVAGENSLEAIRLAALAGFTAIETDVRLSSDSVLVVMHDAGLRRTCLNADGSRIQGNPEVSGLTLDRLRNDYVLKASRPEYRSGIPTLEEYLEVCRDCGLHVFIEPKLNDPDGRHYLDIIGLADRILGRGGYTVTSNNFANLVIRAMGVEDVRLMGILYQTSFEEIAGLGNEIMAVSATRFSPEDYFSEVGRAVSEGIPAESHADDFRCFNMINNASIDYVSTDFLAPDYTGQGETVYLGRVRRHPEKIEEKCAGLGNIIFGAEYLELSFCGSASVRLGRQEFEVEAPDGEVSSIRHQVMLFDEQPVFSLQQQSEDFILKNIELRVVKFE